MRTHFLEGIGKPMWEESNAESDAPSRATLRTNSSKSTQANEWEGSRKPELA